MAASHRRPAATPARPHSGSRRCARALRALVDRLRKPALLDEEVEEQRLGVALAQYPTGGRPARPNTARAGLVLTLVAAPLDEPPFAGTGGACCACGRRAR